MRFWVPAWWELASGKVNSVERDFKLQGAALGYHLRKSIRSPVQENYRKPTYLINDQEL